MAKLIISLPSNDSYPDPPFASTSCLPLSPPLTPPQEHPPYKFNLYKEELTFSLWR